MKPNDRKMLHLLAGGGWYSRQQIASALGKKEPNPAERAALKRLTQSEHIERRGVQSGIATAYEYRITTKGRAAIEEDAETENPAA